MENIKHWAWKTKPLEVYTDHSERTKKYYGKIQYHMMDSHKDIKCLNDPSEYQEYDEYFTWKCYEDDASDSQKEYMVEELLLVAGGGDTWADIKNVKITIEEVY